MEIIVLVFFSGGGKGGSGGGKGGQGGAATPHSGPQLIQVIQ